MIDFIYYTIYVKKLQNKALPLHGICFFDILMKELWFYNYKLKKGGIDMINEDKLKTMSQLALYEKKRSRKDLNIYSYDRDDYIRFEVLKTVILVTLAVVALAGFVVLWNLEMLIQNFDVLNYKKMILVAVIVLFGVLALYIFLICRKSK